MGMYDEKKLSSTPVFDGKIIQVRVDEVEIPNGRIATREVVHHNGGAAIIALNNKNEIALVKQFRYPNLTETLEIPAGKIEAGEDPYETAKRELQEETGIKKFNLEEFGHILPSPGFCDEIIYLYFASNISAIGSQNLDLDEFIDVVWVSLEQATNMILNGDIVDAKSIAAILKAAILKK